MIWLMGKIITTQRELSNELSWAKFGVEEGIQKLTATTLFFQAASFGTFWPFLEDLIFDRSNQLPIEKFHLGWKVDSKTFPTSHPVPDSNTRKALKQGCECARPVGQCATSQQLLRSVNFELARPVGLCATSWAVKAKITSNSLKSSSNLQIGLR